MSDTEEAPIESPPRAPRTFTSAVQLKLPPYWPSDPQIWFAQVEAQFSTRNISSQRTKFDYVVASLAPEFAQEVRDLLLTPPSAAPYDTLKTALVQRTTASEQCRLQQLFSTEELGDLKPSQLLRRIHQLLGDKASATDSSFIRELFLQRLPANVRMVLTSCDTTNLEKLAELADKIVEVSTPQINSAINAPSSNSTSNSELQQLHSEIADLKRIVSSIQRSSHRRSPSRSGYHGSRSRQSTPEPTTSDDLCWYHRRFGDAARKCQSPCSKFQENDQASR